jgi:integrase
MKDTRLRLPGPTSERIDIPNKAELKLILAAATGRSRAILHIAVFTGMRVGEIRALTWDNVDFADDFVRVRHSANPWGEIGSPKLRAGVRDIPMATALKNVLREWKMECPITDLNIVFPSRLRKVIGRNGLHQSDWYPVLERTELVDDNVRPKYHFHALRHCAASLFIEQGLPPKTIQTYMGHATIGMTYDTYGHMFTDQGHEPGRAALAAIERDLLGGNESPTEDAEIVQIGRQDGENPA